jgi:pimeloyl-ACP methyl ester carboxylesterase
MVLEILEILEAFLVCHSLQIRLVFWSRIASISLYLLELKDLNERLTPLGMQQLAENVTGIRVPNSGHFIAEEQPQFVINQLSNFFGRNATTNSIR